MVNGNYLRLLHKKLNQMIKKKNKIKKPRHLAF